MILNVTILRRVLGYGLALGLSMILMSCEHELKIAPEYDRLTVDRDNSLPSTGIWKTQTDQIARPGFEIVTLFRPDGYQCTNTVCYLKRFFLSVPPLFPLGLFMAPFAEEKKAGKSDYLKFGMFGRFAGNTAFSDLFAISLSRSYSTSSSVGALLRIEAEDFSYLPYIEFRLSFLEHRVGEFEVVNEGRQEITRAYLGNGDHLIDGGLAPSMVLGYSLGKNWLAEMLYSANSGYELEIEELESEDFESHAKFQTFGMRLGYRL